MNKRIRVFEAFSGYGSQSLALRNIGIPYEVVAISEIDKNAIMAYNALHKETLNLGDIRYIKEEEIPEHDLFTYSFPCQDISNSGKGKGLKKGSGTRSGLLWECERIIKYSKPKYLLMENVKNLLSDKHKPDFDEWCLWLEQQGYTNYYSILNSKDFNIPQNRERVFMISILGDNKEFIFPKGKELKCCIKDILDKKVEHKYYLNDKLQNRLVPNLSNLKKNEIQRLGNVSKNGKSQAGVVIHTNGISMTMCAGTHGYAMGYITDSDIKENKLIKPYNIRKFTPSETFKLMGLKEDDINKILDLDISDTQLFKLSGNSIVVDVLEEIFKQLFL